MIIADENIHSTIISALRNAGIDVYSIYESNRGLNDEGIIDLARNMKFSILTEDKDFGEWVFAHHVRDISVIFLRFSFTDTSLIAQILCDYLNQNIIIHPVFITLTITKVRIRQLE
jgi:predicted nuclease of predicted toxin-antitoxin system